MCQGDINRSRKKPSGKVNPASFDFNFYPSPFFLSHDWSRLKTYKVRMSSKRGGGRGGGRRKSNRMPRFGAVFVSFNNNNVNDSKQAILVPQVDDPLDMNVKSAPENKGKVQKGAISKTAPDPKFGDKDKASKKKRHLSKSQDLVQIKTASSSGSASAASAPTSTTVRKPPFSGANNAVIVFEPTADSKYRTAREEALDILMKWAREHGSIDAAIRSTALRPDDLSTIFKGVPLDLGTKTCRLMRSHMVEAQFLVQWTDQDNHELLKLPKTQDMMIPIPDEAIFKGLDGYLRVHGLTQADLKNVKVFWRDICATDVHQRALRGAGPVYMVMTCSHERELEDAFTGDYGADSAKFDSLSNLASFAEMTDSRAGLPTKKREEIAADEKHIEILQAKIKETNSDGLMDKKSIETVVLAFQKNIKARQRNIDRIKNEHDRAVQARRGRLAQAMESSILLNVHQTQLLSQTLRVKAATGGPDAITASPENLKELMKQGRAFLNDALRSTLDTAVVGEYTAPGRVIKLLDADILRNGAWSEETLGENWIRLSEAYAGVDFNKLLFREFARFKALYPNDPKAYEFIETRIPSDGIWQMPDPRAENENMQFKTPGGTSIVTPSPASAADAKQNDSNKVPMVDDPIGQLINLRFAQILHREMAAMIEKDEEAVRKEFGDGPDAWVKFVDSRRKDGILKVNRAYFYADVNFLHKKTRLANLVTPLSGLSLKLIPTADCTIPPTVEYKKVLTATGAERLIEIPSPERGYFEARIKAKLFFVSHPFTAREILLGKQQQEDPYRPAQRPSSDPVVVAAKSLITDAAAKISVKAEQVRGSAAAAASATGPISAAAAIAAEAPPITSLNVKSPDK